MTPGRQLLRSGSIGVFVWRVYLERDDLHDRVAIMWDVFDYHHGEVSTMAIGCVPDELVDDDPTKACDVGARVARGVATALTVREVGVAS